MDLRHLRCVVELGKTRSFTRAAKRLGLAQPALSHALASLERELSVQLFERTSRRVEPTAVGTMFIEQAERILADADRLRLMTQEHADLLRGLINIGTTTYLGSTLLPPILLAFQGTYPGISTIFHNETTSRTLQLLREGALDVAFLNAGAGEEQHGLTLVPIERDEVAVALPPAHHLAVRGSLTMDELHDETFIGFRPGSNLDDILSRAAQAAGFAPRYVARGSNTPLVRALVSAGLGISIGSKAYLASPGPPVTVVPLVPRIARSMVLAARSGGEPSPPARAFITFVDERIQASR